MFACAGAHISARRENNATRKVKYRVITRIRPRAYGKNDLVKVRLNFLGRPELLGTREPRLYTQETTRRIRANAVSCFDHFVSLYVPANLPQVHCAHQIYSKCIPNPSKFYQTLNFNKLAKLRRKISRCGARHAKLPR